MDKHSGANLGANLGLIAARTTTTTILARALLVGAAAVFSLIILLRVQLETGFAYITGDIYDGRIEVSVLEHWYNVLRRLEHWNRTAYFYPHPDTLGYNDGYLIYGLIFSVFRLGGVDPILASDLVNATVRLIGFAGFIVLAIDVLMLPLVWAVLGAILFTISNGAYLQSVHQQLLTISFAPLIFWLFWKSWESLPSRQLRAAIHGSVGALLYGAWLLTSFYMAWFTTFFGVLLLMAILAIQSREKRWIGASLARLRLWPVASTLVVLFLALTPFLIVYVPKAHETGQHSFAETIELMPTLLDLVHVGSGNLLFGRADQAVTHWLRPSMPDFNEHTVGFSPVLLLVAILGGWLAWRMTADRPTHLLWKAIAAATAATLLLCLRIHQHGLWHVVFSVVPGAAAIRAETRLVLFLDLPIVLLAMMALANRARSWPPAATGTLAILLVLGELNFFGAQKLDRKTEMAVTDSIPAAPSECRSFYIATRGRQKQVGSPYVDSIYHHNVDAMMISELIALPTINGFSTFNPAGQQHASRLPANGAALRAYADRYAITAGLCGLDLDKDRWIAALPTPPSLPRDGLIRFYTSAANAEQFVTAGWSDQEAIGRWTDDDRAGLELSLPPDVVAHPLLLVVDAEPFAPADQGSSPVTVLANSKPIATWRPDRGQHIFSATIPASVAIAGNRLALAFVIQRPLSPREAGLSTDRRRLGLLFRSLTLSPITAQ